MDCIDSKAQQPQKPQQPQQPQQQQIDCNRLVDAVRHELTVDVSVIQSIKLQNHIYGCFIVMEDIAQKSVKLQDNVISNPDSSFDLNADFGEIGLRYGFAMDMNLMLTDYVPEYKAAWLSYFQMMSVAVDMSGSDAVEDALIHVIEKSVSEENAYFTQAIHTGILPQSWMSKLLKILKEIIVRSSGRDCAKDPVSAIHTAHIDKPLKKPKINPLQKTKRHIVEVRTKHLGTTRRAKK